MPDINAKNVVLFERQLRSQLEATIKQKAEKIQLETMQALAEDATGMTQDQREAAVRAYQTGFFKRLYSRAYKTDKALAAQAPHSANSITRAYNTLNNSRFVYDASRFIPNAVFPTTFIQNREKYRQQRTAATSLIRKNIAEKEKAAEAQLNRFIDKKVLGIAENTVVDNDAMKQTFAKIWNADIKNALFTNKPTVELNKFMVHHFVSTVPGSHLEMIAVIKAEFQHQFELSLMTYLTKEQRSAVLAKIREELVIEKVLRDLHGTDAMGQRLRLVAKRKGSSDPIVQRLVNMSDNEVSYFFEHQNDDFISYHFSDYLSSFLTAKQKKAHEDDLAKLEKEFQGKYAGVISAYQAALFAQQKENKSLLAQKLQAIEKLEGDKAYARSVIDEYEYLMAEDDIKILELKRDYLKKGFFLAKAFSVGCGVFSAGGWAMLIAGLVPAAVVVPVVSVALLLCLYFAKHATRMNWLSSNDEMGELYFEMNVDRGTLHRTRTQRFFDFFRFQSELTVNGLQRGLIHKANTTTAVVWGVLTVVGFLGLAHVLPTLLHEPIYAWAGFALPLGPLGFAMPIGSLIVWGMVALFLGYTCYKVFGQLLKVNSNKVIKEGNKITRDHFEKLWLLSKVNAHNNPTSIHYAKQGATLFGISFTAMASAALIGEAFGMGITTMLGSVSLASVLAYVVIVVAIIGLVHFYRMRANGSVLKAQAERFGGTVPALSPDKVRAFANTDTDQPNYKAIIDRSPERLGWNPFRGWALFSTASNVNSEDSRKVNAVSQGGPAIAGGIAFATVTVGALALFLGAPMAVAFGVSVAVAVLGGVCAMRGSYEANGIGNRKVKLDYTDFPSYEQEKSTLYEFTSKKFSKLSYVAATANAMKAITDYAFTREREDADLYGVKTASNRFTKDVKVAAARFIVDYFKQNGTIFNFRHIDRSVTLMSASGEAVVYSTEQLILLGKAAWDGKLGRLFAKFMEANSNGNGPTPSPSLSAAAVAMPGARSQSAVNPTSGDSSAPAPSAATAMTLLNQRSMHGSSSSSGASSSNPMSSHEQDGLAAKKNPMPVMLGIVGSNNS